MKMADPQYQLAQNVRVRIGDALRISGAPKAARTQNLLGCTIKQLRDHLERLFLSGMGWHNRKLWHVDHVRPCASFDLMDPAQQRCCFHYTNLQPLWAADNIRKSDKIIA
jgi:hypothetical protein